MSNTGIITNEKLNQKLLYSPFRYITHTALSTAMNDAHNLLMTKEKNNFLAPLQTDT